jgi:predicted secreted Zn-dependent protease
MGEAPQFLVAKWDSYLKNLILHEKGHRDRVLDAAGELTGAVAELPPARSCSDLDHQLRTLSRTRLQTLIEEQDKYDAITGHGHAQGVLFP